MQQNNPIFPDDESLYRQVHPTFIQAGRVTSQAFRPTPKDNKKLSVNRGTKTTPQDCFKLHTEQKKLASKGVWAVTIKEVHEIVDLEVIEDPIDAPIVDLSHTLIDFSNLTSEIKAAGSKLADKARARGCLYPEIKPD